MIHHRYGMRYNDGVPHNLYKNYRVFTGGLVCGRDELIYDIAFEECDESEHQMVAWRRTGETDIEMIFKNITLLSVCFPYGLDSALKCEQGQVVYLKEISSRPICKAKDLKQYRAD